ncbi:hypothetical protein SO802_012850 [Lithocarpus litseifolius]|uniref:Bet v I/Major latex protein domain-containing protein n=1 Tax=Lithocarpus litseifolius TaxID=425828 RepID=A0AAW2D6M4_9ROSI
MESEREGESGVFKEKVELDDANRSVTLVGIEGDVMKDYKTFNPIYQVVPKGTASLAKLSIEWETQGVHGTRVK